MLIGAALLVLKYCSQIHVVHRVLKVVAMFVAIFAIYYCISRSFIGFVLGDYFSDVGIGNVKRVKSMR